MSESNIGEAVSLGEFKIGEVPRDLSVLFTEADGSTPVDLTSYTAKAFWRLQTDDSTGATEIIPAPSIPAPLTGIVVVAWLADAFAEAGSFYAEVWAGESGNSPKLASRTFTYLVTEAVVSPAPTFA